MIADTNLVDTGGSRAKISICIARLVWFAGTLTPGPLSLGLQSLHLDFELALWCGVWLGCTDWKTLFPQTDETDEAKAFNKGVRIMIRNLLLIVPTLIRVFAHVVCEQAKMWPPPPRPPVPIRHIHALRCLTCTSTRRTDGRTKAVHQPWQKEMGRYVWRVEGRFVIEGEFDTLGIWFVFANPECAQLTTITDSWPCRCVAISIRLTKTCAEFIGDPDSTVNPLMIMKSLDDHEQARRNYFFIVLRRTQKKNSNDDGPVTLQEKRRKDREICYWVLTRAW
jgi:hypothetical protein